MNSHSPLSCAQVDDLLPEFSTGELDAAQSRAIEEHARTCDACAREIAGWTRASGLIHRAATEEEPIRIAAPTRRSTIPLFARPLALAASLALSFALGLFAGRSGSSPTPQLAAETRESIASRYREVAAASPRSSSLGLALMSIARRN